MAKTPSFRMLKNEMMMNPNVVPAQHMHPKYIHQRSLLELKINNGLDDAELDFKPLPNHQVSLAKVNKALNRKRHAQTLQEEEQNFYNMLEDPKASKQFKKHKGMRVISGSRKPNADMLLTEHTNTKETERKSFMMKGESMPTIISKAGSER
jgi:hypothetical protein